MSIFISPVSTTLPDLAGTGIGVLPYVYDGAETTIGDFWWMTHIRNVDHAGKRYIYDVESCNAVASHLHDLGHRRAIFDMEPHADYGGWSDKNVETANKIIRRFKQYGVSLVLWGLGTDGVSDSTNVTLAKYAGFTAPALYPYTKDVNQWLADRDRRLLKLRKDNRKDVVCILSPQASSQPGDYPEGTYIPVADFERYVAWGVRNCDDTSVWLNCGDGDHPGPWNLPPEHFEVLKKYAKGN